MRQFVYQVCYTRYHVSFYLWLIGSVLTYCKVLKYYDHDCRLACTEMCKNPWWHNFVRKVAAKWYDCPRCTLSLKIFARFTQNSKWILHVCRETASWYCILLKYFIYRSSIWYIWECCSIIQLILINLTDLNKMYSETLESFGLKVEVRIHSTRLKKWILSQFEDLTEHKKDNKSF